MLHSPQRLLKLRLLCAISLLFVPLFVHGQSLSDAKRAAKDAMKAFAKDFARSVKDKPHLVATLQDKRINESSGLACSWRNEGILWTHNDSGDDAWLYAINRKGQTVARLKVHRAENVDWEDIAIGPGENGIPALYISDLGNNSHKRKDLTLYRVEEPLLDTNKTMQSGKTARATAYPVRYPDGNFDCETILVHPKTGEIVFVTKEGSGKSGVYRYPMPLRPDETVVLVKVGEITFKNSFLSGNSLLARGERMTTGGAVSRDGLRAIVRTYTQALEWKIAPNQTLADALRGQPTQFLLPLSPQGESIAYRLDGKALLTTSEKLPTPVMEIPH
jgi:hypothetical protein